MEKELEYDFIGPWSEIKLEILKKYAKAYSTIISNQTKAKLKHVYIDAFAGAGHHRTKETGEVVDGSPINALNIKPSFQEYYFIDLNSAKIKALSDEAGKRSDVHIYEGDCNVELKKILPKVEYADFKRALCILDPYGLHLKWEILQQIGQMKSVEIFLNFPMMDINRNVLRRKIDSVSEEQIKRMNDFWGDNSWREIAYKREPDLFGGYEEKTSNESVTEAFRKRLQDVAGFRYVPRPMAMRGPTNAVLYYLFFATHNSNGEKIAKDIFRKYNSDNRR